MNFHLSKKAFYLLSVTWGLLLTLAGAIVIGCIKLYGKFTHQEFKLKKHGYCYYLAIGENWGGLEFGMFFLTDKRESISIKWHEHGHGIQNCYFGPFMPFVITIPSAIRYHWRNHQQSKGITLTNNYDDIWFEKSATELGRKYRRIIK